MEDEVNNKLIIELSNEGSTLSPFKLGYGASFFIYNSILIMNYMLIVLIINNLIEYLKISNWNIYLGFLVTVIFILYLWFFNKIYKKQTTKVRNNFPENSWLLRL